jgi:hypothetical protein
MTAMVERTADPAALVRRRSRSVAPRPMPRIPRVDRSGPVPLSPAQRRLWLLDRTSSGGTDLLTTCAWRLRGALDMPALRVALDRLVTRHEPLRTRYVVVDGEPAQVVGAPAPVRLTELDLSALDSSAQQARLTALMTCERAPVDLGAGPMVRAVLARLATDDHALLLTTHRIAFDGSSASVLARDLAALYEATLTGTQPALPPLRTQYADWASWQRERAAGRRAFARLAYWPEQLAGAAPVELPTDRPRPATCDDVRFTVPAHVCRAVRALARAQGATPSMVGLAAFAVSLARCCGRRDVTIGTPVTGRDRPETKDLVGPFLDTLAMRIDVGDDPSLVEAVRRTREVALDALAHQGTSFGAAVTAFRAMFVWDDAAERAVVRAGAIELSPIHDSASTVSADLTLVLSEQADGSLAGSCAYATALLDRATALRLTDGYTRLLAGATIC